MTDASFGAGGFGNVARAAGACSTKNVPPADARAQAGRLVRVLMDAVPAGAARFLVAGGLASLFNWLVRFPLSLLLPFELAVGVAYAFGMGIGFALYRSWVFPGSALPLRVQAARFIAVNAAGLAIVMLSAKGFLVFLGSGGLLPVSRAEALAHAAAIVLGAVVNFLGHRTLTFARRGGRDIAR